MSTREVIARELERCRTLRSGADSIAALLQSEKKKFAETPLQEYN